MRKIYLFICMAGLLLIACEDLIEVTHPNNQLGTPQVFEDALTANAALGSLYAALRDVSILRDATDLSSYADDLDCYQQGDNGVMDIYLNQVHESNVIIRTIWERAYRHVYYANSIIHGAENSTALSDSDKKRIKGEAIVIRSLVYFYLQQFFGDIPYTTSLDYEYNRTTGKTEAAALMEQLETDVTEAVGMLEDNYRHAERIYINRKAAQLLLARIYLTRGKWALAEQAAEDMLESPLYEFENDINEVFHKSGKHILWQLKPPRSGNPVSDATYFYFSGRAPHLYALTQDLVASFDDNDLRRQAWIAEVAFNDNVWFRPYKYKNRENNTDEYFIVFRLEEVYFIMAEALAKQNRLDEALPYLNATRERAGLNAATLSGEDFIKELLDEKRREFFTESGHRFIDLKRWGRLNELSTLKPNWEEYKQVWPLPQSEMLLNPNLNPQNAGY